MILNPMTLQALSAEERQIERDREREKWANLSTAIRNSLFQPSARPNTATPQWGHFFGWFLPPSNLEEDTRLFHPKQEMVVARVTLVALQDMNQRTQCCSFEDGLSLGSRCNNPPDRVTLL
jgi:hypothetical protein